MNYVAKEIQDYLMHYGVGADDDPPGRGSGRYPKGSGENPFQHGNANFLERVEQLKREGFTYTDEKTGRTYIGDTAIAKYFNMSRNDFQAMKNRLKTEERNKKRAQAVALRDEGKSLMQIANIMGFKNDSSVRALLNEDTNRKRNAVSETIDILQSEVDKYKIIDIGSGVEKYLGVSKERLMEAVSNLKADGYQVFEYYIPQINNKDQNTTRKVLCTSDMTSAYVKDPANYDKVHLVSDNFVSHDNGETFDPRWVYPESMDSKRLKVVYGDEGGSDKDGLIEIRRGVDDLSLGNSTYAQVRILVDGTHYIKGMAVYSDDLPKGVDVLFNTNKPSGTPVCGPDSKHSVLKLISNDPDNPFGSLIKDGIVDPHDPDKQKGGQSYYYDKDGNKHLSLINKRAEEGDWGDWADKLPSQFLSKQNKKLIKQQLDLTYKDKLAEYEEIAQLNNPTIKKALLKSFALDCDASAVHLKAAALPRQKYQVIIPLTTIKDNEVYAPRYKDGETVALIRYPHGGTFEIPILKVNNKQKEGNKVLSKIPKDAVGINSRVAAQLSGADFDGDTVMVVPCNGPNSKIHITASHPLKDLEGFDPKVRYGGKPEGTYKPMTDTQKQMGIISNLITDMTIKGATEDKLARAVRHSMVVIDAEKHKLDYKQSEIDNDIDALKREYQKSVSLDGKVSYGGAATLISRAKSPKRVPKRQGDPIINPDGSLTYKTADDLYYEKRTKVRMKDDKGKYIKDKNGKYVYETYIDPKTGKERYRYENSGKTIMRTQETTKMGDTNNAYELLSELRSPQEILYADYANNLKALANRARKEMKFETGNLKYNASAKKVYAAQVDSLKAKLNDALKNAPRERQAQAIANSVMNAKRAANKDLTKDEDKKLGQQALNQARERVGAHRTSIDISDKEWEAIQAGAISENVLTQIIKYADMDILKEKATPRTKKGITDVKISRIKTLANAGYTIEQIAKAVGVSESVVSDNI